MEVDVRKADFEQAICSLCHDWIQRQPVGERVQPSFEKFRLWLEQVLRYLMRFRSVTSPLSDIERWFDDELGLNWMR